MVPGAKGSVGAVAEGPLGAALGSRAHLERAAMNKRSPLRNFLMKVGRAGGGCVGGSFAVRSTRASARPAGVRGREECSSLGNFLMKLRCWR